MRGDAGTPEIIGWFEQEKKKGEPYIRILSMLEGLLSENGTEAGLMSALREKAEGGDPDAQFAIGLAKQYGVGAIQPSTDAMRVRRHADTKVLNLRFADGFEQDIL